MENSSRETMEKHYSLEEWNFSHSDRELLRIAARKWRRINVPYSHRANCISICTRVSFARVRFNVIACVRACRDREKKSICILQLSPCSLYLCIITRCLCLVTFRYLYTISIYVCVYACISMNVCDSLFVFVHTEMFTLLLLLTYHTCRRNERNRLPTRSDPRVIKIIVLIIISI